MTTEYATEQDATRAIFDGFDEITQCLAEIGKPRCRPVLGGAFGTGGYELATVPLVTNGLHAVVYYVRQIVSGAVISFGKDQASALDLARNVLTKLEPMSLAAYFGKHKAMKERAAEELRLRIRAEQEQQTHKQMRSAKIRSIPRRRKQVFDASEGKCHYCATPLTLEGKWHIDHKMPRALMGGDEPGNLVAACVPCNHEKRDTTDSEYIAKRQQRGTK